jgi:hypothetical protein
MYKYKVNTIGLIQRSKGFFKLVAEKDLSFITVYIFKPIYTAISSNIVGVFQKCIFYRQFFLFSARQTRQLLSVGEEQQQAGLSARERPGLHVLPHKSCLGSGSQR